jgi:hypothetical protein
MRTSTLFLLSCVVFGLMPRVQATVVTLNPTSDAFVSADNSTSNYGGAGALAVSAADLSNGEFDSVMQFNLSSVAGWTITSVTLQFTATAPNNAIFNGNSTGSNTAGTVDLALMLDNTWTEGNGTPMGASTTGGITYSTLNGTYLNAGEQSLGAYSFAGGTSGNFTWTLTPNLSTGFLTDATNGGIVSLLATPGDNNLAMLMGSRSNGNKPILTITGTVPEPNPGAMLFVVAMLGLAGMRHRRHAPAA